MRNFGGNVDADDENVLFGQLDMKMRILEKVKVDFLLLLHS